MTNAEAEQKIFWGLFDARLNEIGHPFYIHHRSHYATVDRQSANSDFCLSMDFLLTKGFLRVGIYIRDDVTVFQYLLLNRKDIEQKLGFQPIWNARGVRNPNTRRIEIHLPFSPFDRDGYSRLIDRAIPFIKRFKLVFSRYLPGFFVPDFPTPYRSDRRPKAWEQLLAIQEYIETHNVLNKLESQTDTPVFIAPCCRERFDRIPQFSSELRASEIQKLLLKMDISFSAKLLKLIDLKKMDEVECYKRAGVSRQTWSKILNDPNYRPGKNTVIGFAFALKLSKDNAGDLLSSVGFTLSHSNKFDLIVEYFLEKQIYDLQEVNEALFAFDQPLLNV